MLMLPARCRSRLALVVLGLVWAVSAMAAPTEHWYRSSVDHYATRYYSLVLEDTGRGPAVRKLDLIELGLTPPSNDQTPFFRYRGEWFYPLSALPEFQIRIDDHGHWVHFLQRGLRDLPDPPSRNLLLTVVLNGQPPSAPLYVAFRHGDFFVDQQTVRALGLDPGRLPPPSGDGYSLRRLSGDHFTVDVQAQSMTMTVDADRFTVHHLQRGEARPRGPQPPATPSAVLKYDLSAGTDGGDGWRTGTVDAAAGVGSAFCESSQTFRAPSDQTIRLGSRCVWDIPQRVLSVTVGDGISDTDVLGQPVRYGGVRIGTDYHLAPSFSTQPYLSLAGSARVPSVLEIWTDEMLIERRRIPPGRFRIDDLPGYTGAGEMRAVVRDGSGTPQVISQPFYSDPSLLASGLSDWSMEYGYQRRDAYSPADRYDRQPFAVFSGRHGVSDWLTLGLRGEHFDALNMAAANAHLRLWRLGTVEMGGAASRSDGARRGSAVVLGLSRRSRYFSLGVRQIRASRGFAELGYEVPGSAPALQRQINLGLALGRGASLSLGRIRREYYQDQPDQVFDTAGLTFSLPGSGALLMSVFRPRSPAGDTLYSLAFTMPLGHRSNVSASAGGARLENRALSWQTNPPAGPGVGLRASTGTLFGEPTQEGSVIAQNQDVRFQLYGRRRGDQDSGYAEVRGALVANREGVFPSRSRPGGYAVVDAGAPNVRVFYANHLMGRTGDNGKLVVAGLLPYQQNRLRLAPEDLPLNASLASDARRVVPGQHQAMAVRFPVSYSRYVSAHLTRADGRSVPAGARADLSAGGHAVIGHGGLLYEPLGASGSLAGTAHWSADGECRFAITPRARLHYPVDLGEVPCR